VSMARLRATHLPSLTIMKAAANLKTSGADRSFIKVAHGLS